jgi:hypothetical protein
LVFSDNGGRSEKKDYCTYSTVVTSLLASR